MTDNVRDIPAGAVVKRITSPSFAISYPDIWHAERIPSNVLQVMEKSWKQTVFRPREVRISLVENVVVAEEGLVFTRSLDVLQPSITQHSPQVIERAQSAVEAGLSVGSIPHISGVVALCKKRGAGNYGHWLTEMLTMAFLIRQNYPHPASYIVHAVPDPLRTVMRASAEFLGIASNELIETGPAPILVDQLLIVDGLTAHGSYMSPIVMDCADQLSGQVLAEGSERILILREGTTIRRLVDEDAIRATARHHGYALIDPGRMSFEQQVACFKAARRIVGVMGAAMTNLIFSEHGAEIFNLAPANMQDTFFWFIAGLRRLRYTEVRCEQISPVRGLRPWDTDIHLSHQDRVRIFETT